MAVVSMDLQLMRKYRPEHAVMQMCDDPAINIELARGKLLRAVGDNRWRAILCLDGVIWITQDGDLNDHVISAGEMFLISQAGDVLIQGLADARLQITPCLATSPFYGKFEDTIWP
jgi:hypothetical protein